MGFGLSDHYEEMQERRRKRIEVRRMMKEHSKNYLREIKRAVIDNVKEENLKFETNTKDILYLSIYSPSFNNFLFIKYTAGSAIIRISTKTRTGGYYRIPKDDATRFIKQLLMEFKLQGEVRED